MDLKPVNLHRLILLAAVFGVFALTVRAQEVQTATIRPGMTESEVRDALGPPTSEIVAGERKVLSYPNTTIRLESGQVTKVEGRTGPPVPAAGPPATGEPAAAAPLPPFRLEQDAVVREAQRTWRRIRQLYAREDYAALEEMGQQLSRDRSTFADGSYRFEHFAEVRIPPRNSTEEEWHAARRQLEAWMAKYPDSAVARMCYVRFVASYAWAARGSGWSNQVSDSAWTMFANRLADADPVVKELLDQKINNPFLFSSLADIALGQEWSTDRMRGMFLAAKSEHPDIWTYDTSYAYYLQPRWYGKEGEFEKMCEDELHRPGGLGAEAYARVAIYLDRIIGLNPYSNAKLRWEVVRDGLKILVTKYPDSRFLWSAYAQNAVMAGDRATAREGFEHLKGRGDINIFKNQDYAQQCLKYAYGQ